MYVSPWLGSFVNTEIVILFPEIFLFSDLDEDEMEALKTYIIHGPDFDSIDYDVR